MANFQIKQGRNIKLKGVANKEIVSLPLPKQVALQPSDFKGVKPQLLVKIGDAVKVGTPIFCDKAHPEKKVVSPVSGKVSAINRGDKRVLLEIVIETDGRQETQSFRKYSSEEIKKASSQDIINSLLDSGLWTFIRQRPFSKVADPHTKPKSIFIHAMSTEPLAADVDFILQNREKEFQAGLDVIKRLTDGKVHLCVAQGSKSAALTQAQGVEIHTFFGPHPSGNVSTHIHHVDPINKGEIVWYVQAQDVLRIGALMMNGVFSAEKIVAITGEKAKNRVYAKTVIGAPLSLLLQGSDLENARCLSGSILAGKNVGAKGFLSFYDSQVTVIPEGGKRELLGWLAPGFTKYSFTKTFVSSFLPEREISLDTDTHGSHRAIVINHIYDSLVPLDIMTFFLLRSILSGNIEEAEKLGILECDEEDFALCTFACPSKTDVSGIIREGLELVEREG